MPTYGEHDIDVPDDVRRAMFKSILRDSIGHASKHVLQAKRLLTQSELQLQEFMDLWKRNFPNEEP